MSIHLIIPDAHSHPDYNNNRAILLGKLINDVKPDVVINMGDTADLPSLCSYDRGKRSFQGRNYRRDIEAHSDFQDKLWSTVRSTKRKLPRAITLIGNHEERIRRAIEVQPELDGTISYRDLELNRWYDEVVDYDGAHPGEIVVDGITYSHYIVSGVLGRPVNSEHFGHALLSKSHSSVTVGHSHVLDWASRTTRQGNKRIHGLTCGVFQDYRSNYAGQANALWWSGVVIKRNVDNGDYDPCFVSMKQLKKEYADK